MVSCESHDNASLPYYNSPDFTPRFINDEKAVKEEIKHIIGDFSFTDQDGHTITQKSIENKVHVADFFFSSCGSICPAMMSNMAKIDSAFKNDRNVLLLSYSVTPWIDSVSTLKRYAVEHHIKNPNWHLLTGNKSDIYQLARKSYFAEEELGFSKDSTDFLHTEHFILVDQHKCIRGIYNGTLELEMMQLIKDIKQLIKH